MSGISKAWACVGLALLTLVWVGCESPFDFSRSQELRNNLISEYQQELRSDDAGPAITARRAPSDVEEDLTPERREELDEMSGYEAYADDKVSYGPGLTQDQDQPMIVMSLPDAVRMSVENNLDIRQARLIPAISEQDLIQAQAVFDFTYFANLNWNSLDTPGPTPIIGSGDTTSDVIGFGTGVRKISPLTGGNFTLQTDFSRVRESGGFTGNQRFFTSDVIASINQPLLQGFGPEVAQSEIVLARSARDSSVAQLKANTMDLIVAVEQAYWNLVNLNDALKIQVRLLERTIKDRNTLQLRSKFDVTPVQLTEANSFVEIRRANVISTRSQVRLASDQLKQLINSPSVPLSEESLIIPADRPMEDPVTFSLLDSVTTALQQRPEMKVALLNIQDATVRQRVADNARLPILDLTASIGLNGLDNDGVFESYSNLAEANYIDYALGGQFEIPILNRAANANFDASVLARDSAVLGYQSQAQQVVLDVKDSMRSVMTNYELIGANRAARRAAADNLRALEAQEDAGVALTPDFINLKLQAQQRLADTEIAEVQSMTNYNLSITDLYRAMGTLLQQQGIAFNETPYDATNEFMIWP